MKTLFTTLLFLTMTVISTYAGLEVAQQKGIGTIDQFDAHGKIVYRFVPVEPNKEELRAVKFIPTRLKFKKGLPEEMEKFFAEALEEKKEVEIECKFLDKGAGKKTSIGSEIISYKFSKESK